MEPTRFDASLRAFAASAGRRDAVRSLGAVGVGLLAALGLHGEDAGAATGKRRKQRHGHQRARINSAPAPAGPTPPDAAADDAVDETSEDGLVEAEARKKKPKPGPAGPTGPTGPEGPAGATGAIPNAFVTDVFENAQLGGNVGDTATLQPKCPNVNSRALGGGFDTAVGGALSGEVTVNAAFPTARDGNTPEGFQVEVTRTGAIVSGNIVVTAFLKCTA